MTAINPKIEAGWKEVLYLEFQKEYFKELKTFLLEEKKQYTVYPPGSEIFSAFNYTPFEKVKVVIIGQDPYHGRGQANGLCFSVKDGIRKPPSLQNIFKELKSDMNIPIPESGNLAYWAKQGVLLLNAILTVRSNQAGSHRNKGWENFTDEVIQILSAKKENLVFILWGNFAQEKIQLIDTAKHQIISSPHPSPFSADRGFFGSKPFSKTNAYLRKFNINEIDWSLDQIKKSSNI